MKLSCTPWHQIVAFISGCIHQNQENLSTLFGHLSHLFNQSKEENLTQNVDKSWNDVFLCFVILLVLPRVTSFFDSSAKPKCSNFHKKNLIVLLCSWQSGVILFNSYHHNLIVVYFIGCWVISSTRCFCNELKRPNILFPTLSSRFT